MNSDPYTLIEFLDHILKIDADGEFIPKRDENGNVIINKITERPELVAEQEGTRLNARNMNHLDSWLYIAHQRLDSHDNDIMRMKVQMELDGRAPGNSGTFADAFDGEPNKLIRQTAIAVLTAPRAAGTTVLNVDTTDGFKPFTQVTIYDGTNSEDVLITDVTASTITVQPLVNDYVKGARIARSNARIAAGQMTAGDWGTYSVAMMEVV
ncbi:hypothetical protein H7992_13490 [Sporosarcina sp. resist]|uniref:hypothetical protein n=1 Tax=Sporosarcina sp. resist TaxID=2762563 RepID=UPI00164D7A8E|nr:hypothetical protein [Sporosarcina sp. resist]QNK86281.1 hypothetical protein H7992_13490 [Sporosarcina sp. resist]